VLIKSDLEQLQMLSLKSTLITSQSLTALASKKTPNLRALDVSRNELDVAAIEALRGLGAGLMIIIMNGCNLRGDSLNALKDISFPQLQGLSLDYNQFTESDILAFLSNIELKNMPILRIISLKGIPLSIEIYNEVQKVASAKKFVEVRLDEPYHIPQTNAAQI